MKHLAKELTQLAQRSLDNHIRLAVTGLSRAGKTAFITSLVNQLIHSSVSDNLPLLSASREGRILGARRIPQQNVLAPSFPYDKAMTELSQGHWPQPTGDVSEIRLAIKYKSNKPRRKWLSADSVLYLDIIDYPGEWLLDLPMLEMSFEQWSQAQFEHMSQTKQALAQTFIDEQDRLDLNAPLDEQALERVSMIYTDFLMTAKAQGFHHIQPGKFVLPGDLKGAPVLQFFPVKVKDDPTKKNTNYQELKRRFAHYQQKVVKAFYQNHFATFDRQVVLVDCLTPLNAGKERFTDMQYALGQIMDSFSHGRSSFLSRLFAPKIDKVLFAATKADHITPEQHLNMAALLKQMILPIWQKKAFDHIQLDCFSIASIAATRYGMVDSHDGKSPALQGVPMSAQGQHEQGKEMLLFPGDVPTQLPDEHFWQNKGFDFVEFCPPKTSEHQVLPHIRVDKVMDFLLGDKLA